MERLIKKYSILLISALILARLATAFIVITWPDILTKENLDGSTTTYSNEYIERLIEYLINIVFIILIYSDLKKQNLESIPTLIITFFSGFIGILVFLLISAQNHLNFIKTENNERIS
jgi:uncharacterized membrane protein